MNNEDIIIIDNRQNAIHEKGFDMGQTHFGKIKVGVKTLDDAILSLGEIRGASKNRFDKYTIFKALAENDLPKLREISDYFYKTSGIYTRACNYFANLYRYDWYVVPEMYGDVTNTDKVVKDFSKVLNFFDNSYIKKTCSDIALTVIKYGAYYGYKVKSSNGLILQELPIKYCRVRYYVGGNPAVEFSMKFFDQEFPDTNYRMKILKMFPEEFAKGYVAYKQGRLKPDYANDRDSSWYLLDPKNTVKFSFGNGDIPLFINSIPAILDLDAAQDLDRRKQMQKLLKIIVQKLPMDKNGDLVFDVDEARDIHNNAVQMLRRAIGVDVLTTFADIESIDMSDKNTATTTDDLQKVERAVFNSMGISQNLFNTDGNLSLEKSILNDEGTVRNLLLEFAVFFDNLAQSLSSNRKKYNFRLYMLETTQYNYRELSKMYKEQVQMGYSKMLPQIALGHSQSAILNTAYFENEVLHLSEIMIPPLMSSTMSMADLKGGNTNGGENGKSSSNNSQKKAGEQQKQSGRPEKSDDQKSEKTIQNKESMS